MKQCSPRAQSTMSGLPLTLLTVSSLLLILGSVAPAESEVSLMSQNPVAAWFQNMMGIETNPVSRIRRDADKKEEQKSKIGRNRGRISSFARCERESLISILSVSFIYQAFCLRVVLIVWLPFYY